MAFDPATGIYTPPTGSENAAPGDVIRSATWNTINVEAATALTQLAQQAYINGPRSNLAPGSFTVHATDNLIFVQFSAPTITMPLASTKVGPVKIIGANSTIFGSNNSVVVFSGGELCSGLSSFTLNTNWQVVTMYPNTNRYLMG